MNIEQDITVVVGGTRGIGKVISEVLSERGDLIYTISRRKIKNKNHFSLDLSNEKKLKVIKKKFRSQKIKNLIFCQRYRGNDTKKEYLVSTLATKNIIENFAKFLSDKGTIIQNDASIEPQYCEFWYESQDVYYVAASVIVS